MMSYKDRTFCPFWETCANGKNCVRALTEDVMNGARQTGLYISQYAEEPECFESSDEKELDISVD